MPIVGGSVIKGARSIFTFLFILAAAVPSCSSNIFQSFADKNADEALFADAKKMINEGDYAGALTKIASIGGSLASDRKTRVLKASAYAGICGLRFLSFVEDLGNLGSAKLFPFLAGSFVGGTPTRIDACASAETLIQQIGTISERTSDENMFLVLISFAKIGNILSLYFDSDQNGTPDSGLNPCTETPRATRPTAPVAGDWYTADLRQLGSGITLAIANITAVTSTVNLGNSSLSSINNACTTLQSVNPAYDFCAITDPAAFSANQLKGIKSMLKESTVVGLGTDCTGDVSTCFCP